MANSLIANLLNLYSAYYFIFRNLLMIAYKIEIHKSKFANILFREFDLSEPGLVGYQSGTGLSKLPYCIQIYNESFCSVS